MVNNFKEFRKQLEFPTNDSFYFIQIIQRSKDNNTVTSSNNRYRRVKSYYIPNLEEYDKFMPEIINFCENNNARAYVRISPVSFYDVAINTTAEYMRRIQYKQTFKSCSIYDSCCGKTKTCGRKLWMIDLDEQSEEEVDKVLLKLTELGIYVEYMLPTVNGHHIIVKPFDVRKWKMDRAEIKRNNPITLLYYNAVSCKSE